MLRHNKEIIIIRRRIRTAIRSGGKQRDRQPTEMSSNHAEVRNNGGSSLRGPPRPANVESPRPIVFHERASCCCTPGFRNISRGNCYRLRPREKAARPRKRAQYRDSPRVRCTLGSSLMGIEQGLVVPFLHVLIKHAYKKNGEGKQTQKQTRLSSVCQLPALITSEVRRAEQFPRDSVHLYDRPRRKLRATNPNPSRAV